MLINEKIQIVFNNGKEQFYVKNDADKASKILDYDDLNYKKELEDLAKFKSYSCWWAYKHNIGFYPRQEPIKDKNGKVIGYETKEDAGLKARARYIGQESWYDEEHYFWIQFPSEDKPLLAQLRVSNHETKHSQWQKTHSEKRVVNCDTCLNIIINETNRDTFNSDATTPFIITSVEVKYPLKDALNDLVNPNTPVNIFIKQIQNGLKPIVTLNDINKIFNTVAIVKRSGYGSVRDNQYMGNDAKAGTTIPQSKLGIIEKSYVPKLIDNTVENWEELLQQEKEEEERKKREEIMKNTIPTVIPDDAIFNSTRPYINPIDKKELESFEYNGRWYAIESDEEIFNFFLQNDKNVAKYTTCSYIAYLITSDGYIRKKPVIPIAEEWEIRQVEETELKRKKIKEDKYMKIIVKKNNQLVNLGEGRIYSKSQLRLNELDANIGMANGIQQAQMKAKQLMNRNAGVTSASADAGKLDGQKDTQGGEGIELKVPVNANGQQLAQADRMVKNQGADDAQITFTKPQDSSSFGTNESKIVEMRKNSIPFTKKELSSFLNSL